MTDKPEVIEHPASSNVEVRLKTLWRRQQDLNQASVHAQETANNHILELNRVALLYATATNKTPEEVREYLRAL